MFPRVRFKPVLDPIDRVLEVLGGVIMVLTFTSAMSVSSAGEADVREMLVGSLARKNHARAKKVAKFTA